MSDLPQPEEATVASFTDDTAIMAVDDRVEEATEKLQRAVDKVNGWTRKWLIKLMKPIRYMWTLKTKMSTYTDHYK
jgi:hypothetical protein